MADITVRNQGNVSDEGKVNWRGDQNAVPPGGQSVYDSSAIKLAELGARKVVGDRVFRYSRAAGAVGAGDITEQGAASLINVTAGAVEASGNKAFTFYFATSNSANVYAEGYLHAQSGTAANLGYMYRVKSHPIVGTTANATLTLYDPLKRAVNTTDKWSLHANPYQGLTEMTAGTNAPVGVCPIAVTTSDYFWIQTWGPCAMKNAANTKGASVQIQNTGQGALPIESTTAGSERAIIGYAMQVHTASEYGLTFLTIAP